MVIASLLYYWVVMSTFAVPENMVVPAYMYSVNNTLWELSGSYLLLRSLILVLFIGTPDKCIGNRSCTGSVTGSLYLCSFEREEKRARGSSFIHALVGESCS